MTDAFSRILSAGPALSSSSSPATPPPEGGGGADAFSRIMGTAPPAAAGPVGDPNAEPDAVGFVGGLKQMVRGKQDPRFKDLPTVYDQFTDSWFRDGVIANSKHGDADLRSPTATAAMMGASDEQMGDIVQKHLGDRFVRREKDANGYDIFVTKAADGQEQRGYLNKPGLDTQDAWRAFYGASPYVVSGGAAGTAARGAGWVANTLAQGVAAGSTSVAGDLGQIPLGSEQAIEPGKAVMNTVAGAAGPTVAKVGGALWRRFVTEPSLFDRASGVLTDKGAEIAKQAGFDPSQMAADIQKEFAKTYARTGGDASAAASVVADREFKIPSTVGQRSKDAEALMEEKAYRYGVYGDSAKSVMQGFDDRQAEAVKAAALTGGDNAQGIVRTIAPGRTESDLGLDNLGREIRRGVASARGSAQAGEQAAWNKVTDITAKPEAFAALPDLVAGRLGDMPVDETITPVAAKMAQALDRYISGKALEKPVAEVLKQTPITSLDQMRRRLLAMSRSAANDTDRKVSAALYDSFNDFIDDAAEKALVNGDPEAAAAMRVARDTSKTMRQIFQPTNRRGQSTAGAKIIDDVLERSDSAEGIVHGLFGGGPSSNIKDGSVEALKQISVALRRYADPHVATKTWNDVRAAYWVRLVKGKDGKMFTPGVMLQNISQALSNQRSVVHVLYENEEIGQMVRLKRALEQITVRDPNPSNSSVGFAMLTKQFLGKVLDAVPFGRAAFERSGIPDSYGAAVAKRAVSGRAPPAPPRNLTPFLQPGMNAMLQAESDADY